MPNYPQYSSVYAPEYGQALFEALARRVEKIGGTRRRRLIEEYAGAGRYGGGLMASGLRGIDTETQEQLTGVARDVALEAAARRREERLMAEQRAWQEAMARQQHEWSTQINWKDILPLFGQLGSAAIGAFWPYGGGQAGGQYPLAGGPVSGYPIP